MQASLYFSKVMKKLSPWEGDNTTLMIIKIMTLSFVMKLKLRIAIKSTTCLVYVPADP